MSKAYLPKQREPAQFPTPVRSQKTGQQENTTREAAAKTHVGFYTQTCSAGDLGSPQHLTSIPAASKAEQGLGWAPQRSHSLIFVAPWPLRLTVGP